jgi:PAS domain S-box-containing protein
MAADPTPLTVLLLEDSRLDADLTLAYLRRGGYDLHARVADCQTAFIAALDQPYDLILADYDVPGFNGLAALEMTRTRHPGVPFIFVSGVLGEEVAIETLHRGATDYVLKQRLERLVPAVRRALHEAEEHAQRLRAEATAREGEERFRKLTDALPQLVWTADGSGQVTYTNAAWRETMLPGVEHWCDARIIHPEDLDACRKAWGQAQETGEGYSQECRWLTQMRPGEYCWYLVRVLPFAAIDGQRCWLGTATDTHEEKKREAALRVAEKLAVAGRMAATIAHEINNPLESLTNLIFLLRREDSLSPDARQYLELAEGELQRVANITRQTLSFYREPSEQTTLQARELLEDLLRLFGPRLRSRQIRVEIHAEEGVRFAASRGEIRQVLVNLISNSIDAVPVGGLIRLSAQQVQSGRQTCAELRVEDNGCGIEPRHLTRIFEPFFSTKGIHGTGLGLWVSKSIVEKHGGSIRVDSQSNPGRPTYTAMVLQLPLEMRASTEEPRSTSGPSGSEPGESLGSDSNAA